MARWTVTLDNLPEGGLQKGFWREDYPRTGAANQAAEMKSMDLTKQGYVQPGPAVSVYPGGATNVTKTISAFEAGITESSPFAVGGDNFYNLGTSATLIHTISATTGTHTALDLKRYNDNYYYSWTSNVSGRSGLGKYDGSSTYEDDWWANTVSGSLESFPSQVPLEVGKNDVLYFGHKRYVGSYDGTTSQDQALDLPSGSEIVDLTWMNDRLLIPTNADSSQSIGGSIYIWDGTTDSWEVQVPVAGKLGAGLEVNGVYYQFYFNYNDSGKLAYLEGNRLIDLVEFPALITPGYGFGNYPDSSIPGTNQAILWNDYILWIAGDGAHIWGFGPVNEPNSRLFKFADITVTGDSSKGALSFVSPELGILVGSGGKLLSLDTYAEDGTLNFETDSSYKTSMFDIAGERKNGGQINTIRFNFEKLQSGASLDWSLVNSQGVTIYSDTISYSKATAGTPLHTLTTAFYPLNGKVTEDFRLELDYSNGSATAPVRIKNIKIYGEG